MYYYAQTKICTCKRTVTYSTGDDEAKYEQRIIANFVADIYHIHTKASPILGYDLIFI